MKKFLYPLVLSFFCAGTAHAQDTAKLARRLVEASGIDVQLQSVPKTMQDQMAQVRGQAPEEVVTAMIEASGEAYRPDVMTRDVTQALAQSLKPAEIEKMLAWLDTETGRRVVAAEKRAGSTMDEASLRRHAEETKDKPPGERRLQLLQDMLEVTSAIDLGANMLEGMMLGIAIGMDSMQPAQNRMGVARLRQRLAQAMPKEEVKDKLRAGMPGMLAYCYRELGDADLAAYVGFLRSPEGKRYNEAIAEAYTQAMVAASVRLGELVERRTPKRPA
jgi:hypothetical protein